MPRKTPRAGATPRGCCSFNEAAARCRGKLRVWPFDRVTTTLASMRPRPDAAENIRDAGDGGAGAAAASMRPRPDAAENEKPASAVCCRRSRLQ